MPAWQDIPEMVPVDMVAERLGVSPWTVRCWMRTGKFPFYKLGRRVLVKVADVQTLLADAYKPALRNGGADG